VKILAPLLLLLATSALGCSSTPDAQLLEKTSYYANVFGLDAALVQAVIWQESRFCPTAVSPKGAIGLGQLMPATAAELGVDPWSVDQNLWGTANYLRAQYDAFGDWQLALAAYNAGPGNVSRYGGIPPFDETRNYVRSVLDAYLEFRLTTTPTRPSSLSW
jgi:soluble lytic murein transglycosylase-like protein